MIKPGELQTPEDDQRIEAREGEPAAVCGKNYATTMGPFVCQMPKGHKGGHGAAAAEPAGREGG